MTRLGLALIMLCGSAYAVVGLFDSLREFGIGLAVVASASVLGGLVDWMDR